MRNVARFVFLVLKTAVSSLKMFFYIVIGKTGEAVEEYRNLKAESVKN